jgi:hypothetical protein
MTITQLAAIAALALAVANFAIDVSGYGPDKPPPPQKTQRR